MLMWNSTHLSDPLQVKALQLAKPHIKIFQSSGNFNKKSDVYSFGIILFELIAGRIAIVRGLVKNNHILDWVNPLIERGDVQNIIDPRLEGEFDSTSTWKAIEIAMSCIPSYAIQRLDMSYAWTWTMPRAIDYTKGAPIAIKGLCPKG
ncbi:receptor-like protein kinase [Quercus suber]|uniref:Receptor-like protein kinase n=1 Tax=Quercus suber TaxID=58331 RepID=A0AAW0LGV7_QUESU